MSSREHGNGGSRDALLQLLRPAIWHNLTGTVPSAFRVLSVVGRYPACEAGNGTSLRRARAAPARDQPAAPLVDQAMQLLAVERLGQVVVHRGRHGCFGAGEGPRKACSKGMLWLKLVPRGKLARGRDLELA